MKGTTDEVFGFRYRSRPEPAARDVPVASAQQLRRKRESSMSRTGGINRSSSGGSGTKRKLQNPDKLNHRMSHYLRVTALVVLVFLVCASQSRLSKLDMGSSRIMTGPENSEVGAHHHSQNSGRRTVIGPASVAAALSSSSAISEEHQEPGPENASSSAKHTTISDDPLAFGYHTREELEERSSRFPSVDERVRVYMTNWYLPPCENQHVDMISDEDAYVQYNYVHNATTNLYMMLFRETRTWKEKIHGPLRRFVVDESTEFDLLRYMVHPEILLQCDSAYCTDLVKYLFPALARQAALETDPVPILYQFSDAEKTRAYTLDKQREVAYPNVPHLKKFRYALSKEERERVVGVDGADDDHHQQQEQQQHCSTVPRLVPTTVVQQQERQENATAKIIPTAQPIIFKLKMQRHYGYVKALPPLDRPWSEKKDQAIFRGQFTGRLPAGMGMRDVELLSAYDHCQLLHRCRLVYNSVVAATGDSTTTTAAAAASRPLVDARLALPILEVRKDFPQTINGINLYGERVSIKEMLSYKAIIMLEGNDVSSGLKWALFSNSVVLTQPPTKTSWAMEELLEPWVHYIPLADDLSDVQEKMQWVIDNDEEAQRIAHRGQLWISDLIFHPDAEKDEERIFDDILRRYRAHFRHQPTLRLEDDADVPQ